MIDINLLREWWLGGWKEGDRPGLHLIVREDTEGGQAACGAYVRGPLRDRPEGTRCPRCREVWETARSVVRRRVFRLPAGSPGETA